MIVFQEVYFFVKYSLLSPFHLVKVRVGISFVPTSSFSQYNL